MHKLINHISPAGELEQVEYVTIYYVVRLKWKKYTINIFCICCLFVLILKKLCPVRMY